MRLIETSSFLTVYKSISASDRSMSEVSERRLMTSAICGLTVADVRKCLAKLREMWAAHAPDYPMDLSTDVWVNQDSQLSASEFAFKFVIGHHKKRHLKGKGSSGSGTA